MKTTLILPISAPLDIKNATFGSQGRYAGLYEKALH